MESNEKMTHNKILGRRRGSNKKAMEKMIAIRNAAYERGGKYLCELCGYALDTEGGFHSHLYRTHGIRMREYKMTIALKKPDLSKLPVIKRTPAGSEGKYHMLTKGHQDCELCDWTGVSYNAFAGHVRRTHNMKINEYRQAVYNKT